MVVYFVQKSSDGMIKIGYSNCIRCRLFALNQIAGEKVRVLSIFDGGKQQEKELHLRFAKYRISGEWFEPHESLLEYIEKRSHECLELSEFPKKTQFVKAVNIGEKRYRWLEEHPEISFAAIARKAIDDKMAEVE